jgi:hypothetical protein
VIGLRQGLSFRILRTMAKNDNDILVANLLARLEDEEQADAVFVDGGYGTGIISAGRTMGRDWMIVWSRRRVGRSRLPEQARRHGEPDEAVAEGRRRDPEGSESSTRS